MRLIVTLILLLFLAGVLTGMINAVAGGGTFLSFGALTLVGVPPVVANATSSITQFPGYITSTLAYWEDFKTFWRGAIALAVASIVGSLVGAWILLQLDNPQFRSLVPWLLLAATATVEMRVRVLACSSSRRLSTWARSAIDQRDEGSRSSARVIGSAR